MEKTEILLVGTGAVGGFFGGKLSGADVRITALCRSDYEIVRERGVEIRSYKGDFTFKPDLVIQSADEISVIPDYIIVCLKVLPQIDLKKIIKPAVGPDTAIVLVQNGIDIEKNVIEAFPDNEIISGIAFLAARRLELGVIGHTGAGKLSLGSYPKGISAKTETLVNLFHSVSVPCERQKDIVLGRWQKMIWNAAFNPISVLGGCADSKQMVENSESEQLVRKVMAEVMAVAKATGYELANEVIEHAIIGNHKLKPFKTSMLVDYEQGRAMESDAILGNAIALGKKHGVQTPYMEGLYALLKLQETTTKERRIQA